MPEQIPFSGATAKLPKQAERVGARVIPPTVKSASPLDGLTAPQPGASSVPYGLIGQRHDEYDAELLEKVEDLYVGGFHIQRKAAQYLVRLEGETDARFTERQKIFSYHAFFSQIVDQFVSDVFTQPLSVKPAADADDPNTPGDNPDENFYSEFEKDADRRGTSFVDLMVATLRTALKHRRALVAVDAPVLDGAGPASRAEEDTRGLRRLYAYECPIDRLIDWRVDDESGRLEWAVLYDRSQERAAPFGKRDKVREAWTAWSMGADGRAVWDRYEIAYSPKDAPQPETAVSRVDGGVTMFDRIPVLRFELSLGLWVGNKVGPQALEHWQRRTALGGAENRSLVAIPYVKYGPQANEAGGAIPSQQAEDSTRGSRPQAKFNSKGYLELDSKDEIGFAEAEGKCYALVDGQLEKLREAMFQVTFQMAASVQRNNTSMGRSGLSKSKDEDLTERVLRALGHEIRVFAVSIFDTISAARAEDVHWTTHGLDGYDSEDRQLLIQEALGLDQIANAIPSETFHVAHARAIAEKLLKGAVDVETLATIIDELKDGIHVKHEIAELMRSTTKDSLENPAPESTPAAKPDEDPGTRVPGEKKDAAE